MGGGSAHGARSAGVSAGHLVLFRCGRGSRRVGAMVGDAAGQVNSAVDSQLFGHFARWSEFGAPPSRLFARRTELGASPAGLFARRAELGTPPARLCALT